MTESIRANLSWRRWALLGAVTAVLTALAWVGVSTWAWGSGLEADGRLLPGTTIAGTAVGELDAAAATAAVQATIDERLGRSVTIEHDERTWEVTPAMLDGRADIDTAVSNAVAAAQSAGYVDLVRYRWLGSTADLELPVPIDVPTGAIDDFVEGIADDIDREPVDARVGLSDGQLSLVADEGGERVDRDAATMVLLEAFDEDASTVTLPVEDLTAGFTSDAAASVLPAVQRAMDRVLDHTVTVEHGDDSWGVTARELGADVDVERAVTGALEDTQAVSVQPSSGGGEADDQVSVPVDVPSDAVAGFVDAIADGVDREPTDATIERTDGTLAVIDARNGARVDRDEATDTLVTALRDGASSVPLPVTTLEATVTTDAVAAALPDVEAAIDRSLGRTVTFTHEGQTWSTTARSLGGSADPVPVLAAAIADSGVDGAVSPMVPDSEIDGFIASIASEVDVAAVDGGITTTSDGIEISPGEPGLAVDRSEARARLSAALGGASSELSVPTVTIQPDQGDHGHVLVLRQSDRELDLYRDGELDTTWPVAVGTGGSPTPTGTFKVGAKRFEPTWVNPAKDRWGADMPDRIGPGPDNPLGERALNWNRPGGGDTLIRFHGTPNEASIGQASSNGCVRMFNSDVVDLYDRVPSGTTIVSLP